MASLLRSRTGVQRSVLDPQEPGLLAGVGNRHEAGQIDRIVTRSGLRGRVTDSVETALRVGNGTLIVAEGKRDRTFTESAACSRCRIFRRRKPAAAPRFTRNAQAQRW